MLQRASEVLFRWCKRLDKAADRVSGASGPFFILVALCLFGVTIVTYFDVVYREAFGGSAWFQFIGAVLSAYIIYSFLFYYYMAIRTSPGRVRIDDRHCSSLNRVQKFLRAKGSSTRRNARKAFKLAQQTTPNLNAQDSTQRSCKKCPLENGRQPAKPERAHHCRVCQTCILGYDHHCPWIHNCVGVNNSRYFVLFMIALALACFTNIILGRRFGKWTLDLTYSWSKYNTPRICTLLLMVLSLVIGIAMLIMAGWQLLLISRGETSVEAQDNEYYRKLLSGRGQTFVNPYDLGKKKNLQAFFNIAPVGEFVWWSILVPIPLPPTTDGYQWHKSVIRDTGNHLTWEDELTDEDN